LHRRRPCCCSTSRRVAHEILALLHALARGGTSIVCAIHDVNDAAAYADRIALLHEGGLAAFDAPDTVLSSDVLESTYRVAMERVRLPDGSLRVFSSVTR
jgi:iron complex transport system ATP-binding protein